MNTTLRAALATGLLLSGGTTAGAPAAQGTEPVLELPEAVVEGFDPGIVVRGPAPGTRVRLHVLRCLEKWVAGATEWGRVRQPLHAWADYTMPDEGPLTVGEAEPLAGTTKSSDPLALLRTGHPFGADALREARSFAAEDFTGGPLNRVWVRLELEGRVVASGSFQLSSDGGSVRYEVFSAPGIHGILGLPGGMESPPVVISLHGSEGGSEAKARGRAADFASQGFAALALNYFAYPYEAIEGVPTAHREIPLEVLETAHEWLEDRDDLDAERVALHGVSKGAEMALLASTEFDWIDRVIAVVPSDVVWEGYGDEQAGGRPYSSWSLDGAPLDFVPLFPFDPTQEGMYRTNTERYSRSRDHYADRADAARIPIERTYARLLLLAGDRDAVWASGDMSRNLVERMTLAGRADRVSVRIYPRAGHQIAGRGVFPVRLYGTQEDDPGAKDLLAEGDAAADAWRRTVAFLREL